jgi:hypothetical protein
MARSCLRPPGGPEPRAASDLSRRLLRAAGLAARYSAVRRGFRTKTSSTPFAVGSVTTPTEIGVPTAGNDVASGRHRPLSRSSVPPKPSSANASRLRQSSMSANGRACRPGSSRSRSRTPGPTSRTPSTSSSGTRSARPSLLYRTTTGSGRSTPTGRGSLNCPRRLPWRHRRHGRSCAGSSSSGSSSAFAGSTRWSGHRPYDRSWKKQRECPQGDSNP